MYELRPIITFDNGIVLETCMYAMRSIHDNDEKVKSSATHCSSNFGTFPPVERFLKNVESAEMAELESRQEKLLRQLEELKTMINSIRAKMSEAKPQKSSLKPSRITNLNVPDIVIKVNPMYPPYYLEFLRRLLPEISININCYIHSTVSKLPDKTQAFINKLKKSPTNGVPSVNIRLILKHVETAELSVPNCPVQGAANILRYIARTLGNEFYEESKDVEKIDMFLDMSYRLSYSKKKRDILELLNKSVGKTKWLVGKNVTIADIAVYDCLKNHVSLKDVNGNLNKWFNQCDQYVEK